MPPRSTPCSIALVRRPRSGADCRNDPTSVAPAAGRARPAVADRQPDLHCLGARPPANEGRAEAEARATLSGALAVQLASLASRNQAAVQETIDSVVERSPDILSIGTRDAEGRLTASSKDHVQHWQDPPANLSTPTLMQVRLLNGDTPAGRIEIAFAPLRDDSMLFGLPSKLLIFIGFSLRLGAHDPDRLLKVDLLPARKTQFAGSDEQKGRELQGQARGRLAVIAFDRPQQCAKLGWVGDGGAMVDLGGHERPAKIDRNIARG